MASKWIWAERLQRAINGGDVSDDFELHMEEVFQMMDDAIALTIKHTLYEGKSDSGSWNIDGGWLKRYPKVTVLKDTDRELPYSIVPADYIKVPGDRGIYRVGSGISSFKKTTAHYLDRFSGLLAPKVSKETKWWLEGNRIYYSGLPHDCPVYILLIPKVGALDDVEDVPIPGGQEVLVSQMVIDAGMKYLGIPPDLENDNIDAR